MNLFAICLYVVMVIAVNSQDLHETLTRDDVMKICQEPSDTGYRCVITFPKHKKNHKRSTEKIFSIPFNDREIQLFLKPADGFLVGKHTKIWNAIPNNDSSSLFDFNPLPNFLENISKEKFYLDEINNAVLSIITDDDGNTSLDGTIGDYILIHPISKEYYLNITSSREFRDRNDYKVNNQPHIILHRLKKIKAQKWTNNVEGRNKIKPNSPQEKDLIVYPELLIFIDQELYVKLYRNTRYAIRYMLSIFYGVDLRFRTLSEPTIRFSIAGIVIVKSPMEYMLSGFNRSNANSDELNYKFGNFLTKINNKFQYTVDYDIAVLMTGSFLEVQENKLSTSGVGFVGGACSITSHISNDADDPNIEYRMEVFLGAAIVSDNGAFGGISVATHELGHVLGAFHDVDYGVKRCYDGFIMGPPGSTGNRVKFSPCSRNSISKYLQSEDAKCVYNPPPKDEPLPVILPGKLLSMDDQCFANEGTRFCPEAKDICANLICVNSNTTEINKLPCVVPDYSPAEGTPCGLNKFCLNGKCVNDPWAEK